MKFLIDEAIELGIYELMDYYKNPVRYCGMMIASNIPNTFKQRGGANPELFYALTNSRVILRE